MVENAIRHGATKDVDDGHVTLHTFETESAICIEIVDDSPEQLAGVSTKLSQGAAEQAASIQELNATISLLSNDMQSDNEQHRRLAEGFRMPETGWKTAVPV